MKHGPINKQKVKNEQETLSQYNYLVCMSCIYLHSHKIKYKHSVLTN
jgi:hypothetical protein